MDELSFYKQLGLKSNPFQYTNADEEENLQDYFIPPPYFQSVWGDPRRPTSCIIFAPRGGGKSAQRKMIEIRSFKSKVLTLQYSRFEFEKGETLQSIDLGYHLKNINRICLLALLMLIYEREAGSLTFSSTERTQIRTLCDFYLYDLSSDEIIKATDSIKTLYEKGKEFFKRNLWVINSILEALFSKIGLTTVKRTAAGEMKIETPSKNHLETIVSLIRSFGIESIYVLIDKVDETQYTGNDSKASFDLIESIIRDLELLQMRNISFKFFLWSELRPFYKKYARPDRIHQFELKWTSGELRKMMKMRLQAYSVGDKFVTFFDLLNPSMDQIVKGAVEELILSFSHGSPRDMIRICRQMVTEQLRINPESTRITTSAVSVGFNVFCLQRAQEVVSDKILQDLQKTGRLDFTVNSVARVFKIGPQGARSKIQTWLNAGVVKHTDDIPIAGSKKPVHHYAVLDSRVAKSIFQGLSFVDFLRNKVRICNRCDCDMFRDWNLYPEHICQKCNTRIKTK